MPRPIYEIAQDIKKDWNSKGKGVSPYAMPYLEAMLQLESITDQYYMDSAQSVVLYFLANAGSYRGETARTLKAELKALG